MVENGDGDGNVRMWALGREWVVQAEHRVAGVRQLDERPVIEAPLRAGHPAPAVNEHDWTSRREALCGRDDVECLVRQVAVPLLDDTTARGR